MQSQDVKRSDAGTLSYGDVKIIQANGLAHGYLEAGRGPLVLLLHGFPDTAFTWRDTMKAVAGAGFRVVAPFLRGYHPTSIPKDGDYSVQAVAEDMLALMDELGERTAVVVGHDWGAAAAYVLTNLAPQRVRRLVTLAIPHPRVITPDPRTFIKAPHFVLFQFGRLSEWYVARDDLAYVDHLYHYWSPGWADPVEDIVAAKDGLRRAGRLRAALGYYRALFRDAASLKKQRLFRKRIAVPTLSFAGADDGALDLRLFERMPEAFTGFYEGVVVPGAGHFLHRERPDVFMPKLLDFLGA